MVIVASNLVIDTFQKRYSSFYFSYTCFYNGYNYSSKVFISKGFHFRKRFKTFKRLEKINNRKGWC